MADYDLAIIGGGINGAGLARDAAGRGLRVLLSSRGTWRPAHPRPRPNWSMAAFVT